MTEVLAVFRSRAQAVDFNMRLKNFGVYANLINTPKEAGVGCGLSVKFAENSLIRVRTLVRRPEYSAFYGFYKILNIYGRTQFVRIG